MTPNDGLIQRVRLTVRPATIVDTASDVQRLENQLRASSSLEGSIDWSFSALQDAGPSLRKGDWQVQVTLYHANNRTQILRVRPASKSFPFIGVAIDLGTTTIAAELVNLETEEVISRATVYNSQRSYGTDVTNRMIAADKPGGLSTLHDAVLDSMNEVIGLLCTDTEYSTNDIAAVTVAGNTIMHHLLLGMQPSSIRLEPYVPATTQYPVFNALEVGLNLERSTPIFLVPGVSGYVGGDVTAGILATNLADNDEFRILIDIGTNGESILGNRDLLLACSGSAGSAFEGCGLEWGMAAQPGAIDHIWVENGAVVYRTIADAPPKGICGSGLIEALGNLLQAGLINRNGRLNLDAPATRNNGGHPEVYIASMMTDQGECDITLRQADFENLIRDKAALYAGSRILLENAGITFDDVAEILIAGNFGQSLDIEQAVRIGLMPDISREKIRFIGNSSLNGARMVLLSKTAWQQANEIVGVVTCLELTTEPRYFEEYTAALFLPHTDLSLFPSAMAGSNIQNA